MKHLYKLGFREFHLADDIFTSDQKWAAAVCDAVAAADVDILWTASNGIRVESADEDLFKKMRRAGCYRVAFGFESGSDEVLKLFGKGGRATIEQGHRAVQLARKTGIDTLGFFLLGLSPDTEETMRDTIELARRLPLDMLKFGITVAFPGTPMFNEGVKNNWIKSYNWDDYFIYTEEPLFYHRYLDYETILRYMRYAWRRTVLLNPRLWLQRFVRGIRTKEIFSDLYYFTKYITLGATNPTYPAKYYARDRWPQWDFVTNSPAPAQYQKVGTTKIQVVGELTARQEFSAA